MTACKHVLCVLALVLAFVGSVGCGDDAPAGTAVLADDPQLSAQSGCTPRKVCRPDCLDGDVTCVRGTFDLSVCACVTPSGEQVSLRSDTNPGDDRLTGLRWASPVPRRVAQGGRFQPRVEGIRADGSVVPSGSWITPSVRGDAVTWDASTGSWLAAQVGEATVVVQAGELRLEAPVQVLRAEARAVWVTRFGFRTEADVRRIINDAADAGFNVVFFQVRGAADAFYRSAIVPWSSLLTGTLGQDPGWDPLAVAIAEAHARGIELHAYFNVFSGWQGSDTPPASPAGAPEHVLRAHPEWTERDDTGNTVGSDYAWLSPGVPEVRAHLVEAAREVLQNYPVDGLHLDRIRYAGVNFGYNELARARFAAEHGSDASAFVAWRTRQVDAMVRSMHDVIAEARPGIPLTASVWGIYERLAGCSTSQGRAQYFQDSVGWALAGTIESIVPMIYWDVGSGCTDLSVLARDFVSRAGPSKVWAGIHARGRGPDCSGNCVYDAAALGGRVEAVRQSGAAGVSVFASSYLDADRGWTPFRSGVFADVALPPGAVRYE